MKKLLIILFLFSRAVQAQNTGGQINPTTKFQPFNKPLIASGQRSLDAKYKYTDTINFKERAFTSVAEANSYIPSNQRTVGLTVLINTGGSLSNGVITGGTNAEYFYKDGITDGGLVVKNSGGGSSSSAVQTAWVETTGSNSTGTIGDMSKPFLTIDAALDAMDNVDSTGNRIIIGTGNFFSPTKAKIKPNTAFYGSAKPIPNWTTSIPFFGSDSRTAPTKLMGGTVLKGTFDGSLKDGITIADLGIDVGSEYCATYKAGVAQEGLIFGQAFNLGGGQSAGDGIHTLQSESPPRTGIVVRNVASLCKDATSAVHAVVFENVMHIEATGISAYFGQHGIVFKAVGGVATNLQAFGQTGTGEGLIVKSNDYANSYNLVLSDIYIGTIANVGAGITLQNEGNSPSLFGVNISNFNVWKTSYGFRTIGLIDGATISDGTVAITSGNGFESTGGLVNSTVSNFTARDCSGIGFILTNTTDADYNTITGVRAIHNQGGGLKLSGANKLYTSNILSRLNGGTSIEYGNNVFVNGVTNDSVRKVIGNPINNFLLNQRNGSDTVAQGAYMQLTNAVGDTAALVQLSKKGHLDFWAYDVATNPPTGWTRAMRMTRSGKVLIGGTMPVNDTTNANLDVYGSIRGNAQMVLQNRGADTVGLASYLQFVDKSSDSAAVVQLSRNGSLDFYNYMNKSWIRSMRMRKNGFIGMGVDSATTKLQVHGLIYSDSAGFKFPDGTVQITAGGGGGSGDMMLAANNVMTGRIETADNSATSTLKAGAIELQSLAADNALILNNLYYDGSAFRYRRNGPGSVIQNTTGSVVFYNAVSGTAGAVATLSNTFNVLSSGVVKIPNLAGTGTRMVVTDPVGNVATQAIPSGGSSTDTSSLSRRIDSSFAQLTRRIDSSYNQLLQLGDSSGFALKSKNKIDSAILSGASGGSSGGGGTLSNFTANSASPLFTTSVATATTTPALSFFLSNTTPYTLFGRGSGTGQPSYISSLDSNYVPGLHSQAYYDARYALFGASTLPAQTSNAGKFLKTDGTTATWSFLDSTTIRNAQTPGGDTILSAFGSTIRAKTLSFGDGPGITFNKLVTDSSIKVTATFTGTAQTGEDVIPITSSYTVSVANGMHQNIGFSGSTTSQVITLSNSSSFDGMVLNIVNDGSVNISTSVSWFKSDGVTATSTLAPGKWIRIIKRVGETKWWLTAYN